MYKLLLAFLLFACSFSIHAQTDELEIKTILNNQVNSWNEGNLDKFMVGYWEHDSLVYIGKSGVTYGYANALASYKKNYPGREHMGTLKFTLIRVEPLEPNHYFVVGKWELERPVGNASGFYTLIFRKINGVWKIVADHSS